MNCPAEAAVRTMSASSAGWPRRLREPRARGRRRHDEEARQRRHRLTPACHGTEPGRAADGGQADESVDEAARPVRLAELRGRRAQRRDRTRQRRRGLVQTADHEQRAGKKVEGLHDEPFLSSICLTTMKRRYHRYQCLSNICSDLCTPKSGEQHLRIGERGAADRCGDGPSPCVGAALRAAAAEGSGRRLPALWRAQRRRSRMRSSVARPMPRRRRPPVSPGRPAQSRCSCRFTGRRRSSSRADAWCPGAVAGLDLLWLSGLGPRPARAPGPAAPGGARSRRESAPACSPGPWSRPPPRPRGSSALEAEEVLDRLAPPDDPGALPPATSTAAGRGTTL